MARYRTTAAWAVMAWLEGKGDMELAELHLAHRIAGVAKVLVVDFPHVKP